MAGLDIGGLVIAALDATANLISVLKEHATLVPENRRSCERLLTDLGVISSALQRAYASSQSRPTDPALESLARLVLSVSSKAQALHEKVGASANPVTRFVRARVYAASLDSYRARLAARLSACSYAVLLEARDVQMAMQNDISQVTADVREIKALLREQNLRSSLDNEIRQGTCRRLSSDSFSHAYLLSRRSLDDAQASHMEGNETSESSRTHPYEFAMLQAQTFERILRDCDGIEDCDARHSVLRALVPWLINPSQIALFSQAPAATVEDYLLTLQRLGGGQTGNVYLSSYQDEDVSRQVAVKLFHARTSLPAYRGAFYRQLYVHFKLSHLDSFVTLHGAHFPPTHCPVQGVPALLAERAAVVMERMDMDLRYAVTHRLLESHFAKAQVLIDVATGLSALHANSIAHFDLRAEHVLLKRENGILRAKLIDFGNVGGTSIGSTIGISGDAASGSSVDERSDKVRAFWAPEVWRERTRGCTHAADVWSFGALMLWLLDGFSVTENRGSEEDILQVANNGRLTDLFEAEIRERPPSNCILGNIRRIAGNCILENPTERLSIDTILELLEAAMVEFQEELEREDIELILNGCPEEIQAPLRKQGR